MSGIANPEGLMRLYRFLLLFLVLAAACGEATRDDAGLFRVQQGGHWGYIDKKGQVVINPQFDAAFPFSDGQAGVVLGGKWGLIDKTGKYVLKPQFEQLMPGQRLGVVKV